jgi:hypothetical protein
VTTISTTHVFIATVVLDAASIVDTIPLVSAVAALISGGGAAAAAGDAATLAALAMMTCGGHRTWETNTGPQRLVISVFYDMGPGAALFGNIGLALACFTLLRIAVWCRRRRGMEPSDTWQIKLRYPNVPWSAFMFILPGVAFSAVSLLGGGMDDDQLLGTSKIGHLAAGVTVLVAVSAVLVYCIVVVMGRVAMLVHLQPTTHIFCEPYLPRWFMRLFASWLLPRVGWEPKHLERQYGNFFSSVASKDALWVHPLLQVHGAVFSLIAAVPFPPQSCLAQFLIAIGWMCVPIAVVLLWRLQLNRRPTSDPLILLSSLLTISVLIATAAFSLGPVSQQSVASSSRDLLSALLSAVNVLKVLLSFISAVAEWSAKRNWSRHQAQLAPQRSRTDNRSRSANLDVFSLRDLREEERMDDTQSIHLTLNSRNSFEDNQLLLLSLHVRSLDDKIEELLEADYFTSTRDKGLLSAEQWERLKRYSLELLITRASRVRQR